MLHVYALRLLLALSAASLVACGGNDDTPEPAPEADVEPTLSDIQAKILTPTCATSKCHDGTSTDNSLNLSEGKTFAESINIGSDNEVNDGIIVKPFEPENSLLYTLLSGPKQNANKMPKSGSLSAKRKEAIRLWIANGAQNN